MCGERDQDGELRQAGTPRRDVRQDVDGDGREDNCGMLNTCEVCAAECQRGGGKPAGEGRCCHCMRKAGDVFEEGESCKICWIRELGARRFDGVALNREQKRVLRSSPRGHPIASMVMHSDVMKERLNSMQALYERRTKWRSRQGGPYYKSISLQD